MRRTLAIFAACLLSSVFCLLSSAAPLPGYEDFRRVDRTRRLTGQMLTAELLKVSQMDAELISRTAKEHADDPKMLWGAAELLVDWTGRREFYERALAANGTNVIVATRFVCAAAKQGDAAVALPWLRYCRKQDNDNTVPWLAELWLLRARGQPTVLSNAPPVWTTNFRDYSVEASRARIRLLEAAGYSRYAARRLGFTPDSPAIVMARDLCKPPVNETTATLLKDTAQSLQQRPQFLLSEFVGETIERTLMGMRPDADTSVEVRFRSVELDKRREELKDLLAEVEHNTVDFATEAQMVQYFDDVLDKGEETAMKRLAEAVRGKPSAP